MIGLTRSAAEPGLEQLLALLGALAAVCLCLAEQVDEFAVAIAVSVLDVGLQTKRIAQALLGEPDEVVVLVLRAGYLSGLLPATGSHVRSFPSVWCSVYSPAAGYVHYHIPGALRPRRHCVIPLSSCGSGLSACDTSAAWCREGGHRGGVHGRQREVVDERATARPAETDSGEGARRPCPVSRGAASRSR